jgi:2-phosphoglycolate phosphatase
VKGLRYRLRCVLFDLDGTLVDTAPDLGDAANKVRAAAGLAPLPTARYRPVASAGARGLLKVALDLDPAHPDFPARRESFLSHYRAGIARRSKLFPGMDAALQGFEAHGLRWGVVTNKPQWLTDPLMEALDLARRAAVVVGARDGVVPKPAPDSLLLACAQLQLKPRDCVYVGDDRRDIVAARAAAMPVIAAGWGYLGEGERPADWKADEVLAAPRDLLKLCR